MPVRVFTSTNCPACKSVKQWLASRGVSFEELNIDENEKALYELSEFGAMSVPVIDVNGRIIVGFNLPELLAALNRR